MDEGTTSSKYLNRTIRQLHQAGIHHEIKLQEGDPLTQIKRFVAAHDIELVIIAGEPYGRIQRLFLGEIITPLLHTLNRPLLIAVPAQAS